MIAGESARHQRLSGCSFPNYFISEIFGAKDSIHQHPQIVHSRRIAMQIEAAGWLKDAVKLRKPRRHHRQIGHHWRMFKEAVERFHQLDHGDVWAVVDELMIGVGGIGPAPRVGEGVELRLAYLTARLAKENILIGVRVNRRIEINKVDAR